MAPSQQAAPKPVIVWHRVSLIVTLTLAASTVEAVATKRTAADSCRKIALFVINSFFIIVQEKISGCKVTQKKWTDQTSVHLFLLIMPLSDRAAIQSCFMQDLVVII
jgi:hypothetical protein